MKAINASTHTHTPDIFPLNPFTSSSELFELTVVTQKMNNDSIGALVFNRSHKRLKKKPAVTIPSKGKNEFAVPVPKRPKRKIVNQKPSTTRKNKGGNPKPGAETKTKMKKTKKKDEEEDLEGTHEERTIVLDAKLKQAEIRLNTLRQEEKDQYEREFRNRFPTVDSVNEAIQNLRKELLDMNDNSYYAHYKMSDKEHEIRDLELHKKRLEAEGVSIIDSVDTIAAPDAGALLWISTVSHRFPTIDSVDTEIKKLEEEIVHDTYSDSMFAHDKICNKKQEILNLQLHRKRLESASAGIISVATPATASRISTVP